MKNKKGWIKIVEAFMAILLVAGITLIVIEGRDLQTQNQGDAIREIETSLLRQVQLNNSMRQEIVATSGEVEWGSIDFPTTKAYIIDNIPASLNCQAKICGPSSLCSLETLPDKSVFVETVFISTDLNGPPNPRVLKLFCWEK